MQFVLYKRHGLEEIIDDGLQPIRAQNTHEKEKITHTKKAPLNCKDMKGGPL